MLKESVHSRPHFLVRTTDSAPLVETYKHTALIQLLKTRERNLPEDYRNHTIGGVHMTRQ